MWLGVFHLAIGNLLIGIFEGFVLARAFGARPGRAVGLMILANYGSAIVGAATIGWASGVVADSLGAATLDNIGLRLGVLLAVYFVVTFTIEFPLVWCALRPTNRSRKVVAGSALLVNLLSYAALAVLYFGASGHSLLTDFDRESSLSWVSPHRNTWVYYIDDQTDRLAKVRPDGTGRINLDAEIPEFSVRDSRENWLYGGHLVAMAESDDSFSLRSCSDFRNQSKVSELPVVLGPIRGRFPTNRAPEIEQIPDQLPQPVGPGASFSSTPREIRAGFWPVEGLRVRENGTELCRVSWETPFEAWHSRSATELEDGLIVYQLGYAQIAILDPVAKRISLVARGRCPVVVIEEEPPTP